MLLCDNPPSCRLDAVKCLSGKIHENVHKNMVADVSEKCQNQIRAELMEEVVINVLCVYLFGIFCRAKKI